jgi:hypothetical protein
VTYDFRKELDNVPGNPPWNITHFAGHEKTPSLDLLAMLGKLLQVEEFADRASPAREKDFMKHIIFL